MKKQKNTPQHYSSVNIATDVYSGNENVKVEISTFFFHRPICEFWVPRACVEKIGNSLWVPTEIIKARALRDFGVTFDSHSGTLIQG